MSLKTTLALVFGLVSIAYAGNDELFKSTTLVAPPTSCVNAVRNIPANQRDRILKRGLDRKVVATLAGAVSQLSGRGDMQGNYETYLDAVLTWIETLQKEQARLASMQKFLKLHQTRWIELNKLLHRPDIDLSKPIHLTPIGNIDRVNRTACPTAPYATPSFCFSSRSAIQKEMRRILVDLVLVRDEFGAESIIRIGMHRWMLQKLYQEATLKDQEAARDRVKAMKDAGGIDQKAMVTKVRQSQSADKLLDLLYLNTEDPGAWILGENGQVDQRFTSELDGMFNQLLNPLFDKVHDHPGQYVDKANDLVKKGYQGVTWINKSWGTAKSIIGIGAIYTALLTLGSDAWTRSMNIYTEYTTPDAVIAYQAQAARVQKQKVDISDKTITAIATDDNPEDVDVSFAEVFTNYVRENAGDRAALLFSQYLKSYIETGRSDWQPESEDDKKKMGQIADLVALMNIQLFNEGPFPSADGKPQRILSSAVTDRWPWRTDTKKNLELVMQAMQDKKIVHAFPLPDGVKPPSYMPAPPATTQWKIEILANKIWDRHLSKGTRFMWETEPIRYAIFVGIGIGGVWYIKRRVKLKDQFRLEPIELPGDSTPAASQ